MQDSWLSKKFIFFANIKDMKKFHDALKTVYDPKSSGATPLLSADGSTLLADKYAILQTHLYIFIWKDGKDTSIAFSIFHQLSMTMTMRSTDCYRWLDEFSNDTETRKMIQQRPSGKNTRHACNSCQGL